MGRTLGVAVLLVGLLTVVSQAALPRFDITRVYTEAGFGAAIKPYTDAIARNASDAEAHYWLGVAYLHGARLFRMGLAPFAAGFAPKAVAELERAVELNPTVAAMLDLAEAYAMAGAIEKYDALMDRLGSLAQPSPMK